MAGAESVMAVQRVRSTGTDAVTEVLDAHRPLICRLARRAAGDGADVEDVIQDALIAVATSLRRFRGECKLSTWIAGITVRTATRCALRRRREAAANVEAMGGLPAFASDDPAATAEGRDFEARLGAAIAQLAPDHRAAVVLRHIEGLSLQEAAQALGVPLGTVKSRLHHARRALEERLAPYLTDSGGETP